MCIDMINHFQDDCFLTEASYWGQLSKPLYSPVYNELSDLTHVLNNRVELLGCCYCSRCPSSEQAQPTWCQLFCEYIFLCLFFLSSLVPVRSVPEPCSSWHSFMHLLCILTFQLCHRDVLFLLCLIRVLRASCKALFLGFVSASSITWVLRPGLWLHLSIFIVVFLFLQFFIVLIVECSVAQFCLLY